MAGGHGTRLWPLSTKTKPKQFQQLIGDITLLQAAYNRLNHLDPENIYVSTNPQFAEIVREQLPNLPQENIIIEPIRRDTGPAMAFVSHFLAQKGHTDDVVSIIYADHHIGNIDEFQTKLKFAQKLAKENKNINIVQVEAKEPNTQLGYVKIGAALPQYSDHKVHKLDQFVEKPDQKTAEEYAQSPEYLWNTGLYSWHIGNFLELLKQHAPQISQHLEQINDFTNCLEHYEQLPKISIDYALMEKLSGDQVHIIPANFTWSDVGNWQTIHGHLQDNTSNVTHGDVQAINTNNSIIYARGPQKIVTIGINDLAIISTDDTILICPKTMTNEIKDFVEREQEN